MGPRELVVVAVLAGVLAAAVARDACDDSARVAACLGAYDYCAARAAAHAPAPPPERDPVVAQQTAEYPERRAALQQARAARELCVLCLPALALCLDRADCAHAPSTAFARYADQCANVSQCARCLFVAPPAAPRVGWWARVTAALRRLAWWVRP